MKPVCYERFCKKCLGNFMQFLKLGLNHILNSYAWSPPLLYSPTGPKKKERDSFGVL
jgi:hypothetical protein